MMRMNEHVADSDHLRAKEKQFQRQTLIEGNIVIESAVMKPIPGREAREPLKRFNSLRRQLFCGLVSPSVVAATATNAQLDDKRQLLRNSSGDNITVNAKAANKSPDQNQQDARLSCNHLIRMISDKNEQQLQQSQELFFDARLVGSSRKHELNRGTTSSARETATATTNTNKLKEEDGQEHCERLIELMEEYKLESVSTASDRLDFEIEGNWTDIVDSPRLAHSSEHLELNQKIQQDAIWELCTTEVFYLRRLNNLIVLFFYNLLNLQENHGLLMDVDIRRMFSNIVDIYKANCLLWKKYLEPIIIKSRQSKCPLDLILMREGFVQIKNIFSPYYSYCLEHTSCLNYVKEQNKCNKLFRVFLSWCESQKDCERLKLTDLLAKPMQRLTRYSLLLRAIEKRTDNLDCLKALGEMIIHMNRFVLTVDLNLRRKDEWELLVLTSNSIDFCDSSHNSDLSNEEIGKIIRKHYNGFNLLDPLFDKDSCKFNCHRQLLLDSRNLKQHHSALKSVSSSASSNLTNSPTSSGLNQANHHDSKLSMNVSLTSGGGGYNLKFKDSQTNGKIDVVLLIFTDQLLVCKQINVNSNHNSRWQSSKFLHTTSSFSPSKTALSPALKGAGSSASSSNSNMPQVLRNNQKINASSCVMLPGRYVKATTNSFSDDDNQQQQHSSSLLVPEANWSSSNQTTVGLHQRSHYHASASCLAQNSKQQQALGENCKLDANKNLSFSQHDLKNSNVNETISAESLKSSTTTASILLKLIRSPYPINRIALHELKGGNGIFCCQLNDSKTIANSFILYCQQQSLAPSASSNNLVVNNNDNTCSSNSQYKSNSKGQLNSQSSTKSYDYSSASRSDSESFTQNNDKLVKLTGLKKYTISLSRSKDKETQPIVANSSTKQLIALIKQAQIRFQFAADFHNFPIRTFQPLMDLSADLQVDRSADAKEPDQGGSKDQKQATKLSRLTAWSSFRQSRRLKNLAFLGCETSQNLCSSTIKKQDSSSIDRKSASSNENASTPPDPFRQKVISEPLMKAIVEQHQLLLLNHCQHELLSSFDYNYKVFADELGNNLKFIAEPISLLDSIDSGGSRQPHSGFRSHDGSRNSVFLDEDHHAESSSRFTKVELLSPQRCEQQLRDRTQSGHSTGGSAQIYRNRYFSRSARVSTNERYSPHRTSDHNGSMSIEMNGEQLIATQANYQQLSHTSSSSSARSTPPLLRIRSTMSSRLNERFAESDRHQQVAFGSQFNLSLSTSDSEQISSNVQANDSLASLGTINNRLASAPASSHRKNLNYLKRQNVIFSASSENQQISDQLTANSGNHIDERSCVHNEHFIRHFLVGHQQQQQPQQQDSNQNNSSQGTTFDQLSVTFDDSSIDLMESQQNTTASSNNLKATSFELGTLKTDVNQKLSSEMTSNQPGKNMLNLDAHAAVRSASVEARSPISVTLTGPINDNEQMQPADRNESNNSANRVNYLHIPSKSRTRTRQSSESNSCGCWSGEARQSGAASRPVSLSPNRLKMLSPHCVDNEDSFDSASSMNSSQNPTNATVLARFAHQCASESQASLTLDGKDLCELHRIENYPQSASASSIVACQCNSSSNRRCNRSFENVERAHLDRQALMAQRSMFETVQTNHHHNQANHLRVAISDASMLNDFSLDTENDDALIDMNCINSLMRQRATDSEENSCSLNDNKGYLGFHEKLSLHNRMLREEGRQWALSEALPVDLEASAGLEEQQTSKSAFSQFKYRASAANLKRAFLMSSKSQQQQQQARKSPNRQASRALKLTRSMTGEIFDTIMRAASLRVSGSGGRV